MACSRNSKISFGVAACLAVVGVLLLIVGRVTVSESFDIGFESENKASVTLKASTDSGELGYSLHIRASDHDQCDTILGATTIKPPADSGAEDPWMWPSCEDPQEEWEAQNEPPLRKMGHFFLSEVNGTKIYGDYTVTSTVPLWIVDSAEELGEAIGGIFAMMGLLLVAVVAFVASCIMCCVGCCCMGRTADTGKPVMQGTVMGQPAP